MKYSFGWLPAKAMTALAASVTFLASVAHAETLVASVSPSAMGSAATGSGSTAAQSPASEVVSATPSIRARPLPPAALKALQRRASTKKIERLVDGAELASVVAPSAAGAEMVTLELVKENEAEKKAEPKKDVTPTPDIELWLGERIGRFGDYEFPILGGKPTHPTPTGAFQIEWKSRSWWSKQYDAEMKYSCFFKGGAAIHEGSLRTMSHGCVHVGMDAAKKIFAQGREKKTRVIVYP